MALALDSRPELSEAALEELLAPTKRGMSSWRYQLLVWSLRIGIVVAFLAFWEIRGTSNALNRLLLSSPSAVTSTLGNWVGENAFWTDLRVTLTEAFEGYLLGVGLAVVAVAVIVSIPWLDRFMRPFIAVLNAVPKVVLAPLFIVWFGINTSSKVYFVASLIFFIVFYNVEKGLKSIDRQLIDNTRALGASRLQLVRNVHLPAVVTWIMSSLRLGVAFALLAAVFAEFLGATAGLGRRISTAQQLLHNDEVMAGILVIASVALVLDRLLLRVERRYTRWRVF